MKRPHISNSARLSRCTLGSLGRIMGSTFVAATGRKEATCLAGKDMQIKSFRVQALRPWSVEAWRGSAGPPRGPLVPLPWLQGGSARQLKLDVLSFFAHSGSVTRFGRPFLALVLPQTARGSDCVRDVFMLSSTGPQRCTVGLGQTLTSQLYLQLLAPDTSRQSDFESKESPQKPPMPK